MEHLLYKNSKFLFLFSVMFLLLQQSAFSQQKIVQKNSVDAEIHLSSKPVNYELEIKINSILKELRSLLSDQTKKAWFRENMEIIIAEKSAEACPKLNLISLIYSSKPFISNSEMNDAQLYHVIDLLSSSITGLTEN